MTPLQPLGRVLLALGIVLVVIGAAISFGVRLPGFGRLPGDFVIRRENFTFYFPLGTSILISLILTFLFRLLSR